MEKEKAKPTLSKLSVLAQGSASARRVPQHLLTSLLGAPRCSRPRVCCWSRHTVSTRPPHSLIGRQLSCCWFPFLQGLAFTSSLGVGDRAGAHGRGRSSPCAGTCCCRKPSSLDMSSLQKDFLHRFCVDLSVGLGTSLCDNQERRSNNIERESLQSLRSAEWAIVLGCLECSR